MKSMEEGEVIGFIVRGRVRFFFFLVITEALLAIICVLGLVGTLYFKSEVASTRPEVVTAMITVTSGIVGSLTTILMAAMNTAGRVSIKDGHVSIDPISPSPLSKKENHDISNQS